MYPNKVANLLFQCIYAAEARKFRNYKIVAAFAMQLHFFFVELHMKSKCKTNYFNEIESELEPIPG